MSAPRERAVELLVNYLEAIAKKAGMKWDPDYTAEIREAVDAIVDPLEARIAKIGDRLERVEELADTDPSINERLTDLEGRLTERRVR